MVVFVDFLSAPLLSSVPLETREKEEEEEEEETFCCDAGRFACTILFAEKVRLFPSTALPALLRLR